MSFRLPISEIEKLNAVKEKLDTRDSIVEGPKNDAHSNCSTAFHVDKSRIRKALDEFQRVDQS